MPLSFRDHAAALRDARTSKQITIPMLAGDYAEEVTRKGIEIPTVTLSYRPTAINYETENALSNGHNFEGAMEFILATVESWDVEDADSEGKPIPWPITWDGLQALNRELPEAVIGIFSNIMEDYSEKKGSRSGSPKRSSTRSRR